MQRHRFAAFAALLGAVTLAGCRGEKGPPPAPPPPKVTVVRPATAPVRDYWEYNGHLATIESVEVRARVKGFLARINFPEGKTIQGEVKWLDFVVYPGDLLYEIDKREYLTARTKAAAELEKAEADVIKAEADVKNWKAQIDFSKAEYNRVEDAVNKGVGSKNDLDKAQATVDVNTAQHAAAQAFVKAANAARDSAAAALRTTDILLGYTDVRAKISGQIGETLVDEGNLVLSDPPTLLTGIIRVDKLYVYFDVPERDVIEYLREADRLGIPHPPEATVPFSIRLPGQEQEWHPGEIDYVEGSVNTGTGTVRARGVIDNPRRPKTEVRKFLPGFYVQVRVPKGPPASRLVLPEDALMTGQEGRFVYVVGANNTVEKRLVTLGASVWKAPTLPPGETVPSWAMVNPNPTPPEQGPPPPTRRPVKSVVAITAGLKPDDRVIVDGLQRARPGAPAVPEEWVMNPP
jgi:RND family efflux transporter MFP subunit